MGQLIIFEGLDGSGKGTQTKLTAQRLKEQGRLKEISNNLQCYFSLPKAGINVQSPPYMLFETICRLIHQVLYFFPSHTHQ